jgi:hypothetical protein
MIYRILHSLMISGILVIVCSGSAFCSRQDSLCDPKSALGKERSLDNPYGVGLKVAANNRCERIPAYCKSFCEEEAMGSQGCMEKCSMTQAECEAQTNSCVSQLTENLKNQCRRHMGRAACGIMWDYKGQSKACSCRDGTCWKRCADDWVDNWKNCDNKILLRSCEGEQTVMKARITGCPQSQGTSREYCRKQIQACNANPESSFYCNPWGSPIQQGWLQIEAAFLAKESKENAVAGTEVQQLGQEISEENSKSFSISEKIRKGEAPDAEGIKAMYFGGVIQGQATKLKVDEAIAALQAAATARAAAKTAYDNAPEGEKDNAKAALDQADAALQAASAAMTQAGKPEEEENAPASPPANDQAPATDQPPATPPPITD